MLPLCDMGTVHNVCSSIINHWYKEVYYGLANDKIGGCDSMLLLHSSTSEACIRLLVRSACIDSSCRLLLYLCTTRISSRDPRKEA
ncbi:uncharacterized protein LOC104444934 isoform X4 [Eucalyptus grandis]|uniref:uncharacterized protein LOC104444934 isoform X4 n=1 Tax=Eucalyptus grandis TaxID=71139 RepID=UPI00192E7CC5|nr:uncharacterized protein LOC104444934 isoform X4 [Eucalyptus grandis]